MLSAHMLALFTLFGLALGSDGIEEKVMPNDVVAKRFAAHNAHELEQFLSCYSSEIQVYDYPDQPIGRQGKDHIRSIFEPLFNDKAVKTTVHQQIVKGSFVIIEETVVRRGETYEYVSIYEVEDGLIKTVRFIKG